MSDILDRLIGIAMEEDIGVGDITTSAIITGKKKASARIEAKQELILAGIEPAGRVFTRMDDKIKFEPLAHDGDRLEKGASIANVSGHISSLLTAERTALNFLQHLSGIATYTNLFVTKIAGTRAKILDTRKTTPGWRALEKAAVRAGCGENHRMGLFDRFLIKNNHVAVAGSITEAIKLVKSKNEKHLQIEVEAHDLHQVEEAVNAGADIIMLDNFTYKMVFDAVQKFSGSARLEVSGNINLGNALEYAKTGVDYISIGAITHSAPAADIHMVVS